MLVLTLLMINHSMLTPLAMTCSCVISCLAWGPWRLMSSSNAFTSYLGAVSIASRSFPFDNRADLSILVAVLGVLEFVLRSHALRLLPHQERGESQVASMLTVPMESLPDGNPLAALPNHRSLHQCSSGMVLLCQG
jgi:hypothetical protein